MKLHLSESMVECYSLRYETHHMHLCFRSSLKAKISSVRLTNPKGASDLQVIIISAVEISNHIIHIKYNLVTF